MLSLEWELALKLRRYKVHIFSWGYEQRREQARQAIRHLKLQELECWQHGGRGESFASAFTSVYGVAL